MTRGYSLIEVLLAVALIFGGALLLAGVLAHQLDRGRQAPQPSPERLAQLASEHLAGDPSASVLELQYVDGRWQVGPRAEFVCALVPLGTGVWRVDPPAGGAPVFIAP